ncbi:S-adenosyl-L-methionine-dependent methyltransferase [Phascolomyces articulosus]|uniref:S-adenosyl-L-methionine-dependent methyltransferase n=1 Tax=Phascolomyces articulosus TaxID=60185 RepID=A0AAD5JUX5_9FUNG|nr:S-adenosyl-L-methionine-dependent methyltransferase [Phascolomyces articulosus]
MGFISSIRIWVEKYKQEHNPKKNNTFSKRIKYKMDSSNTVSDTRSVSVSSESSISGATSNTNYKPGHKFEAGRRFHDIENVSYFFPNDDDEVDRLHQQHWIVRHIMGGNYQSPIGEELKNGIVVLDSGCGPGTWSLDMGEMYPNSTFHGVDAYPVFPSEVKPRNCHFQTCNIAEKLPFPDNHFDFIHQRLLIFGLTRTNWRDAINELLRVLKPGGWLEILECDIEFQNEGPKQHRVMDAIFRAFSKKDMSPTIARELGPDYLQPTGQLEVLNDKLISFPMNHGGKTGSLFWSDFRQGCEALHAWVQKEDKGFEDLEEYKSFMSECAAECTEYKTNMLWHCYSAQKKQSI